MAPASPRLRILSVGGNAVSAFLSWRLQATNACDVTLVWKSGFDNVAQYGISFKSALFGNERFKPHAVVRSPEDASGGPKNAPFDYVLLCVKALPDVYDIAAIIESVVTSQHTCILINTTHSLGIESYLEQRYPTNVVLSLVSGAELVQLGASEFEHRGATDVWVGPANKNPSIPASIQSDMAEALAMTLSSGQVDCRVAANIRQQQFERMIGPIAFHPASVLLEAPSHADLLEKVGMRPMITGVIDELLRLAKAYGCIYPENFPDQVMEDMAKPSEAHSVMYQDFEAKRPMEVETYLGSPMKLATQVGEKLPRIETLYAMLHHFNIANQTRPAAAPVADQPVSPLPPRSASQQAPMQRGPMPNGMPNGMPPPGPRRSRQPSMNGPPPPGMRRGPPPLNGFPPRMPNGNGYAPNSAPPMARRPSFDGNDLEEFSHVMLYDNMPDGAMHDGPAGVYSDGHAAPSPNDLALRERELALRQRELALRAQEMNMRRGPPRRGPPPQAPVGGGYDDEDDEDDYFDPMSARAPGPPIDPENFDMMSVTSRRTRKTPSVQALRKNPELMAQGGPPRSRGNYMRPGMKNRASTRMMADVPGLHDSIMNNPLMGYSSNRYGAVDRQQIGHESRSNSLTAARLDELQSRGGSSYGGYPPHPSMARRASQSPGNPFSPGPPGGPNRSSPPNGYPHTNGMQGNGRPSPPNVRQPVPRHPPGHGNAVAPQQVEQHVGRGEW